MIQNYDQSIFLAKNQQNATHFFTYGLFCCKLLFFEMVWLKWLFRKQKVVITFMPIGCNIIFFEIMSLVKSKFI